MTANIPPALETATSHAGEGDCSSQGELPNLAADRSFWGLLVTQFLGAFNDNLFKQIVLFVCVNRALADGSQNLQGLATFAFALPFVLMSGGCGVLADRCSKRTIIVWSKILEILVMVLGGLAFWSNSLAALILVLGAMGAQSALFGPPKYGIMPELFRARDLPQANGWVLMTTFLSIILGQVLAGGLMEVMSDRLWMTSIVCVGIAILGTLTALPLRQTPIAHPGLKLTAANLFVAPETRRLLWSRRELAQIVFVSSIFWCVGAVYQLGINDLGRIQLQLSESKTAFLAAWAAVGIAVGGSMAGKLSQGKFNATVVKSGLWGMTLSLLLLASPGPFHGNTLLGVQGSAVVLAVLGASAGLFAVPISVYAQAMTPGPQKGQMIGVMNLCNWIGILGAAGLHLGATRVLASQEWPANLIFLVGASLLGIVLVGFRPVTVDLSDRSPEIAPGLPG